MGLKQTKTLGEDQPKVDFNAADNCCLNVTTMKAINFQDDILSIPIDNFKDYYVLCWISFQYKTLVRLVRERTRVKLNFAYLPEHVTELNALGKRITSVSIEKSGDVGKKF